MTDIPTLTVTTKAIHIADSPLNNHTTNERYGKSFMSQLESKTSFNVDKYLMNAKNHFNVHNNNMAKYRQNDCR